MQGLLHHRSDLTAQGIFNFLKYEKWGFIPIYREGDIAFYGDCHRSIRHCSYVLDDKLMIESGGGKSSTLKKEDAILLSACVRIRPVQYRTDYLLCLRENGNS